MIGVYVTTSSAEAVPVHGCCAAAADLSLTVPYRQYSVELNIRTERIKVEEYSSAYRSRPMYVCEAATAHVQPRVNL